MLAVSGEHTLLNLACSIMHAACPAAYCRPAARQRPWTESLVVDAAGVRLPLGSLSGCCTGLELSLAADSLPFGTVVLGSRTTKRLGLANTGDVGARFAWDVKALGRHFSIYPAGAWVARSSGLAERDCGHAPFVV